jgi:hypothetical protein
MNLLSLPAIAAAASGVSGMLKLNAAPRNLAAQANFAYGSGGTSVDAWLQTSFDQGATWTDIANWHFTTAAARKVNNLSASSSNAVTAADGALAANTSADGLLGPWFRVKWVTVGTYAGATSLSVDVACDQLGG